MTTPPNSVSIMMDGALKTLPLLMPSQTTLMVVNSTQSTHQHGNTLPSQAVMVMTTPDGCGQSKTSTSKNTGTRVTVPTMPKLRKNAQPSPGMVQLLRLGAVLPLGETTPTLLATHLMTAQPSEVQFQTH